MRPNPRLQRLRKLAVAVSILVSAPRTARGCACAEFVLDPAEALGKSSLVFVGEVVAVQVVALPVIGYSQEADKTLRPLQSMERKAVVTLRTIKEWKGSGATEYTVLAGAPPETPGLVVAEDCEMHLDLGKKYLVFVEAWGYAEANPCAPSSELEGAKASVAALDALVEKASGRTNPTPKPKPTSTPQARPNGSAKKRAAGPRSATRLV